MICQNQTQEKQNTPPPATLSLLQSCPSYSGHMDHINLGPNSTRYRFCRNHIRQEFKMQGHLSCSCLPNGADMFI